MYMHGQNSNIPALLCSDQTNKQKKKDDYILSSMLAKKQSNPNPIQ